MRAGTEEVCRELHKDLLQRDPSNLNPKPERFRALGIRDDVLAYGSEHSEVQRRGGECNYAGQDEEGRMFGSETLTTKSLEAEALRTAQTLKLENPQTNTWHSDARPQSKTASEHRVPNL